MPKRNQQSYDDSIAATDAFFHETTSQVSA